MNKTENSKILRYAKKIKAINHLGGECVELKRFILLNFNPF